MFDGIFYDTYGEHFTDLEDFHEGVARTLKKPSGVYSFFNGLAPDNLFFHGVACQCVKLQLARMGMDSEFAGEFYSIRFNIYCSKQNFICILTIVTLISFLTLYTKSMPNPSDMSPEIKIPNGNRIRWTVSGI